MAKFLLFFLVILTVLILVVIFVFDNWVRHPGDPRLPVAVVTSQWAQTLNDATTKFYIDHLEIKEEFGRPGL